MKNIMKKSLAAVVLLLLLSSVCLSLFSCTPDPPNTETPPKTEETLYEKDSLLARIESCKDFSSKYIHGYFIKWLFPEFDKNRLYAVESTFRSHYVEELGTPGELALAMADCFFEYFYGEIDLHDKDEMTVALINCLIHTVGDDYAVYRTKEEFEDYDTDMSGEITGIGVQVIFNNLENTCLIESVHAGSGAEKAGILPGDYIVAVDDVLVSEMGYQKTISSVRGEIDTHVKITVSRNGQELSFDVVRSLIVEQSITYSIDNDKIGYVKITGFKENTADQFKEAIDYLESQNCVGVIYDLRSNPGGYLSAVVEMLSYIAPSDQVIVSFSNDYASPIKDRNSHSFLIPSVVICNGYTASAGELFTSAIRDFGAAGLMKTCIVGEKSYGKGIMQSTFEYSDGATITLTVAYYNPPSGENYHGKGITPNVISADMEKALDDAYAEINKLLN